MDAALHNAVSGLRASGKRLEVSAANVVSSRSTGYTPSRVIQTAQPGGGTRADAIPVNPPTTPSYEPDNPAADDAGMVRRPNVALEAELVEQTLARRAFEANLKVVETADRVTRATLDILA